MAELVVRATDYVWRTSAMAPSQRSQIMIGLRIKGRGWPLWTWYDGVAKSHWSPELAAQIATAAPTGMQRFRG